jgi:hypothetical protein
MWLGQARVGLFHQPSARGLLREFATRLFCSVISLNPV